MLLFMAETLDAPQRRKLERLYAQYGKKMYAAARRICGDLAEDAVQNAFVSIAKNIEKTDGRDDDGLAGYVIAIAKNEAYDLMRKTEKTEDIDSLPVPDPFSDPAERVFERDAFEAAVKLIRDMDDKYRTPLYLVCVMGMSIKEAASSLRLREKTVGVRVYRAKKLLADKLKEAGYEY
ncbi:MAG: sigma-70 family RNA polymerase sigma factor [Clostridia bacterium]|nr:sigma-70 family RNA polymerase sigma factor [Clostridia bacterium]